MEGPKDYGLNLINEKLNLEPNEELWLGLVKFRSGEHARSVMEKFDQDEEVNRLYNEFIETVTPLNKITYGEFLKESY